MAEKPNDTASDPGAASQRPLQGRKTLFLFVAGLLVLVLVSMLATTYMYSSMNPEPEATKSVSSLPEPRGGQADASEIAQLRTQMEIQAEAITRLEAEVASLKQSSAKKELQQTLASQERSFQQFLVAMKGGMEDIAKMVRGSRTWLEHYHGRLDEVIVQSRARSESLAQRPSASP